MKKFLAVDFGTTQTSVALLNEGSNHEPEIIEINDGQRVVKAIATALQLDEKGNILYFGSKALAKSEDAPERTFQNFKVFVGSREKTFQLQTAQEDYTPDRLASLYLTHLRELIEEHYFNGAKLSSEKDLHCVVGCPADWNNIRKEKLKIIAQNSGFPNIKLCDEPTGVIYFNHFFGGLKFKKSQNILVYDFGGGTTDISIARVDISDNGEIKPVILAAGGLQNLGGLNFDEAIAAHYLSENHYDLSTLSSKDRLHDEWVIGLAAREAKEELSKKDVVEKTINRLKVTDGTKPQKLLLSRDDFMTVCADLIEKFDEPIYDSLTYAELSPEDIDFVILAGGSSAMPYVKSKMGEIFSAKKIFMSPSTEVIAQGLAASGMVQKFGKPQYENEAEAVFIKPKLKKEPVPFINANIQITRKKRKFKLIASIATAIAVTTGILYFSVSNPANNYQKALALKDSGQYSEAIQVFSKLGNYKDSLQQVKELWILTAAVGDFVVWGKYEQDSDTSNGKEDIEWLVLAKENDRLLLISRYVLDCQKYNSVDANVTWENCTLRHWLNDTFINTAFSDLERAKIPIVRVNADENMFHNIKNPGNSTQDKIFLLSLSEVSNYFESDSMRQCKTTDYAKSIGVWTIVNEYCWWWLRTSGYLYSNAVNIDNNGSVYVRGSRVNVGNIGVRPAFWFSLYEIL